jgi:hypothetical protein
LASLSDLDLTASDVSFWALRNLLPVGIRWVWPCLKLEICQARYWGIDDMGGMVPHIFMGIILYQSPSQMYIYVCHNSSE